jgi:hypothetical protein
VQEAWIRLERTGPDRIEDLDAWLTTVVARLALDTLRSARVRRETYVGPWLPEPLVSGGAHDPADRVTLDESVSYALLACSSSSRPRSARRSCSMTSSTCRSARSRRRSAAALGRCDSSRRARRHVSRHGPGSMRRQTSTTERSGHSNTRSGGRSRLPARRPGPRRRLDVRRRRPCGRVAQTAARSTPRGEGMDRARARCLRSGDADRAERPAGSAGPRNGRASIRHVLPRRVRAHRPHRRRPQPGEAAPGRS